MNSSTWKKTRRCSYFTKSSTPLAETTACDKLNVAALGNQVQQLHVHIIARKRRDAAWPKPVWGVVAPSSYNPDAREILIAAVRSGLQIKPVSD